MMKNNERSSVVTLKVKSKKKKKKNEWQFIGEIKSIKKRVQ